MGAGIELGMLINRLFLICPIERIEYCHTLTQNYYQPPISYVLESHYQSQIRKCGLTAKPISLTSENSFIFVGWPGAYIINVTRLVKNTHKICRKTISSIEVEILHKMETSITSFTAFCKPRLRWSQMGDFNSISYKV